jgi:hypothetical protein
MAYGYGGHVAISFQQSFGTSFVGSPHYFNFLSETLTDKIAELVSESISSRFDENDDYGGMRGIEGEIVFEMHPTEIGVPMKAVTGVYSLGFSNSCYLHTFIPNTTDWTPEICALPPMTIEVYRGTGSAYRYYDCLANNLSIEIAQGAFLKATLGFVGAQFAWGAKLTPSYYAGSMMTWDVCSVQLAGAAVSDISQLTVAINNNLTGKAFIDTKKYPSRILRDGRRTVEVSGTSLLNGDTQARAFENKTKQRIFISATLPNTIMLGHFGMSIDVPQFQYSEFPANIGGVGLIEVGWSGKGKIGTTSNYSIQFTLTNTQGAY